VAADLVRPKLVAVRYSDRGVGFAAPSPRLLRSLEKPCAPARSRSTSVGPPRSNSSDGTQIPNDAGKFNSSGRYSFASGRPPRAARDANAQPLRSDGGVHCRM